VAIPAEAFAYYPRLVGGGESKVQTTKRLGVVAVTRVKRAKLVLQRPADLPEDLKIIKSSVSDHLKP
jgi:hypothetical protein